MRARNSEDTRRSPRVSSETSAIASILPALLFYIVPKWNTTHSLGHSWTWGTFRSHEDIWASSFTVFLSAVGNNFFNRKLNSVMQLWENEGWVPLIFSWIGILTPFLTSLDLEVWKTQTKAKLIESHLPSSESSDSQSQMLSPLCS